MTIDEVIARIRKSRPSDVEELQIIAWISNLDMRVYREVIQPREGGEIESFTPYNSMSDRGKELLVPQPWDEMYLYWIEGNLAYWLGEDDAYNMALSRMQSEYEDYKAYYASEHRMKNGTKIRFA